MEDHEYLSVSSSSKKILPASPNDSEYWKISKIATSMMHLQVAEDENLSVSSSRILPASPNDLEYRKISKIATSMMRLQVAEDDLLKEIQTILAVSPETAPQLEKYISPNIRARLNSGLHSFGTSLIYKYFCFQLFNVGRKCSRFCRTTFKSSRGIRQSG
jgi:hypothetical protein